ncbi:hypothetical protein IC582_003671 [Cucumis melo]
MIWSWWLYMRLLCPSRSFEIRYRNLKILKRNHRLDSPPQVRVLVPADKGVDEDSRLELWKGN